MSEKNKLGAKCTSSGIRYFWGLGSRLSHSFQGTLLLPVSPLASCPTYPQTTKAMAENTQMVICTTFQYDSTTIIYIATLPELWSPVRISSHLRIQLDDRVLLSLWHIISWREGDLENVGFHVWKQHQNNINNDEGNVWQLALNGHHIIECTCVLYARYEKVQYS